MFGKNKIQNSEPDVKIEVEAMPSDFYGGSNPVINFKNNQKEVFLPAGSNLSKTEKQALDKATLPGGKTQKSLINLLTNFKFLILVVGVLFVLFAIGGGVYYWWLSQKSNINSDIKVPEPQAQTETPSPNIESQTVQASTIAVTTTEAVPVENIGTSTPETNKIAMDVPPEYPIMTLARSADSDKDDVSDIGEELFSTDPNKADSDEDKYTDGHEVFNLYNPGGKEPMKIIDSGLVRDFVNPVFGYKIYYPANWAVGNVDQNYRDVLFSTLTGESVEVRAIEKEDGQSFSDWFARFAPQEKIGDLKEFVTAFKDKGYVRSDNLVYYITAPRRVYVIVYHTVNNTVNYGIVIKMMARSFRFPLSSEEVAPPIIESGIETTSTVPVSSSTDLGL